MDVETSNGAAASSQTPPSSSALMEDCLKLLRGETDSQRLAGLLLVTKVCNKDDHSAILRVYQAIGSQFLLRLLRTGMGNGGEGGAENSDAYLELSVRILAAFCRVPQIAASPHMLPMIPLLLRVLSQGRGSSIIEDCYEFLFLVANAQEDGVRVLFESEGIQLLASQMPTLPHGSNVLKFAMSLVRLIISKLPAEEIYSKHPLELAMLVVAAARIFGLLHTELKFEALHLLSAILYSQYSSSVLEALRSMCDSVWSTNMRAGVVAILNNRVGPADKLRALFLAERTISIVGEEWLIGPVELPDAQKPIPASRCIQLVFETSRVEIAVLLNEMAYLRDAASKTSSSNAETITMKCQNIGTMFSLVEKVIKIVSKFGEGEEPHGDAVISDSILLKIISGLNETINVVLEYLQDAKEHEQNKGDDLLAAVRIVGRYLAETHHACREKVKELLGYMLSIQGEDEHCVFCSTSFLLPMLCQITMTTDGCELFTTSGALIAATEHLISLVAPSRNMVRDNDAIFLACDTVLNFLVNGGHLRSLEVDACLFKLLGALSRWTERTTDLGIIMMASSICALILDPTSEEALLCHPGVSGDDLHCLSQLMKKSLGIYAKGLVPDDTKEEIDLYEIVTAGYSRWADRFPHIKEVIEKEAGFGI